MPEARLETRADGYVRWRVWDPVEKRERYAYVHQLTAIAHGADPYEVFSDGEFQVHHRDELKWNNTPDNLEVKHSADHAKHHDQLGVTA